MSQRAFITGVAGFAGGYLAEHLLDNGDAVLGSAVDGKWAASTLKAVIDRVELAGWDLGRPESPAGLQAIVRFQPDCIYHLAGLSMPEDCGASEPNPQALAVNVDGTRRVLALAAGLEGRPRVLVISSSHVYAPVSAQAPQVAETAPLGPSDGYGRTKLMAEELVRHAVANSGMDAVIARSFQHTGPGQSSRMMLSQWARQFAAGGNSPVAIYTGNASIDLTDVRDVVRAYRLLMERGERGEVYNIGSGIARTSGAIFDVLREAADPARQRPIAEIRPGVKQDPIADVSRLVRATGWRPEIPLEKTVADTFAWWQREERD